MISASRTRVRICRRLCGIGAEPVFPQKRQAVAYAETRACFRSGEIRVLGATGKLERIIAFSEADRKL